MRLGRATRAFCAWLIIFSAREARAAIPPDAREAWIALLHYRWQDGRWTSRIHDPAFFLHPDGERDPEGEWEADMQAFALDSGAEKSSAHAQCRFPARFALVRGRASHADERFPRIECPEFTEQERRIGASSLAAVFVSQQVENPASAFGHAMLYLGTTGEIGTALSRYSVSFEANTEGLSPSEYLPRGLLGKLAASYRVAPLHERVQRYEREEQRDLWVFPLRVDSSDVRQLVRHLWELKDVSFRYGFFGGNCAERLLAVVHAVVPTAKVWPHGGVAVLPAEAVRHLTTQLGLGGPPLYRPSLRSRFRRQVSRLDAEELAGLQEIVRSGAVSEGVSPATLLAAQLWSELSTPDRSFRRASDTTDHQALTLRRSLWARVERASIEMLVPEEYGPVGSILESHRPSRVAVRAGARTNVGPVAGLEVRWLLHDALDPATAYPSLSSIEVGRIDVGLSRGAKPFIDEITAIRVERLAARSASRFAAAWKLDLGMRRIPQPDETPLHLGAEIALGPSVSLAEFPITLTAFSLVGVRPGLVFLRDGTTTFAASVISAGFASRFPGDFRVRMSVERASSVRNVRVGATATAVVVRKGLTPYLDFEAFSKTTPAQSTFGLGLVSFR